MVKFSTKGKPDVILKDETAFEILRTYVNSDTVDLFLLGVKSLSFRINGIYVVATKVPD